MKVRARRLAAVATVAAALTTARAQPAAPNASPGDGAIDAVALVRCVSERALPCLRVRVTAPSSDDDSTSWSGRLGPYPLQPVTARVARAGGPPRAVLVLVDASGSMAGEGAQAARAAVRSFLRDLAVDSDSGVVRVAVASFASRGVVAGIRAATFGTPAAVTPTIDRLQAPAGNTGLYAAVAAGAARVAAEARALGPDARPALVVVTDGRNDVRDPAGRPRPGDDADLLTGAAGRSAAAEAARRLGVVAHFVGVGGEPDMGELRALAAPTGLALRTALDAVALREALTEVERALAPGREILFVVAGAERVSLPHPGWPITVTRRGAGGERRFAGVWSAPLIAMPAFDGAALRGAQAPAWLRLAAEGPAVGQRGLVALFLAALVAGVWWLPRLLWVPGDARAERPSEVPGTDPSGPNAAPRTVPLRAPTPAVPAVAAPVASGGTVRADVRDAPPRRPGDITASTVRRSVPERDVADSTGSAPRRSFAVHPSAPSSAPGGSPARSTARPDPDQE